MTSNEIVNIICMHTQTCFGINELFPCKSCIADTLLGEVQQKYILKQLI